MADQWYYAQNNQRVGPVSLDQLRQRLASGQVKPTDMVLRQGAQIWDKLSAVLNMDSDEPIVVARTSAVPSKQVFRLCCPTCRTVFKADASSAGKKAKCKNCGQSFRIDVPTESMFAHPNLVERPLSPDPQANPTYSGQQTPHEPQPERRRRLKMLQLLVEITLALSLIAGLDGYFARWRKIRRCWLGVEMLCHRLFGIERCGFSQWRGQVTIRMHTTSASLLEQLRQPGEPGPWARFVKIYTPLYTLLTANLNLHQPTSEFILHVGRHEQFVFASGLSTHRKERSNGVFGQTVANEVGRRRA